MRLSESFILIFSILSVFISCAMLRISSVFGTSDTLLSVVLFDTSPWYASIKPWFVLFCVDLAICSIWSIKENFELYVDTDLENRSSCGLLSSNMSLAFSNFSSFSFFALIGGMQIWPREKIYEKSIAQHIMVEVVRDLWESIDYISWYLLTRLYPSIFAWVFF